jgi:hypothetical protein
MVHYGVHKNTVTVIPRKPDHWPPKPGDLWRVGNHLTVCISVRNGIFDRILDSVDADFEKLSYDSDDNFDRVLAHYPGEVSLEYRPGSL